MPVYDPNGNEWPLEMCKVKEAWDLPLPAHGEGKSKGEGIAIAHLDTGWTRHPELIKGGRYWTDALTKNFFGRFSRNYGTAEDPLSGPNPSHGTTTASLMLSEEGHPGADDPTEFPDYNVPAEDFVTGIAPKVEVIPLRVTNFVFLGAGYTEGDLESTYGSLTRAIYYTLSLNTDIISVISISMGGLGQPKYVEQALKKTRQKGVITIAAAGQVFDTGGRIGPSYPGTSYHTICVAGCDKDLNKPPEGFYGPMVELTTPGWGVIVARSKPPPEGFIVDTNSDGTSYSTALTAGACALWQASHGRSWLIKKYGRPFLLDVFRYCLANSVNKPPGWDNLNRGNGILDVKALLDCELPSVEMAESVAISNQWKQEDWGDPSEWGRE